MLAPSGDELFHVTISDNMATLLPGPLLAMPGIRPMTTDTPGQPPAIEGERVARAGARWTREEEEQLVVEVRGGTDLAEIAGLHGRTRGGIKSRLVRMIPDGEDVPDSEQLAWITARLRGDPGFDWRAQLERVSDDSLAASEAARSAPRAGRVTDPDVVLAVWQQVNGRELSDQRKAEFLAHPALDDLTAFSAEILAETGRRPCSDRLFRVNVLSAGRHSRRTPASRPARS